MELSLVFNLLMIAAIVGGVLYLFNMLPIDATVKKVANVLALIAILLWAIRWIMHQFH